MTHSFWCKNLFLFLLPFTLLGQTPKKDLTKLNYEDLKKLYFDNENNKSKQIEYATAYLAKANKENISIRKARSYYWFALLYYQNNENKAIMYLDSVIKYSKNTNDKFFPTAAYCEKASFLKKKYKFKEVMINYNLAEKNALKTNIDYYYTVRNAIAITKSEDLGEVRDALDIFKECYNYYKKKDIRDAKYSTYYQNILFGLADSYKALKQIDSATYYNKLGYKESKITKNEEFNYLFVLNEGANHILSKKYKPALDSINKALPKMIAYNNVENTLAAYYYLGMANDGLAKKDEAAKNFIKVDSIYKKTKDIAPEFMGGYPFLVNYYKDIGNKEKQLEYLTSFMSIESRLNKNYKELDKLLQKEYDTPHLMSEKETLIKSLKNDKSQSKGLIIVLLIITLLISFLGFYQRKLKKTYKERFEKIINEHNIIVENKIEPHSIKIPFEKNSTKSEDIGISQEIIIQILDKLKLFEDKKEYLKSNITIQTLSQEFETNTKYLSKIVNEYKEKSFIQYINDLRIQNAITILQHNKTFRKYTIQALALEFGFNNAESFSTSFYKNTGIKPTFFIKELERI
jgi:AraC-like DNA-binding protein